MPGPFTDGFSAAFGAEAASALDALTARVAKLEVNFKTTADRTTSALIQIAAIDKRLKAVEAKLTVVKPATPTNIKVTR